MAITISEISDNSTHLSGNPIWVKATSSGVPAGATNYRVLLKIVDIDGVLYGGPFIAENSIDGSNVCWFNISGWVDQFIEKDFNWPLSGRVNAYPDLAYGVFLYAGERYIDSDGEPQESFQSVWGSLFIVKGKLTKIKLAEFNDAGTDWFTYFASGGKFLTLLPDNQWVSPWQPVKLWYKYPSASGAAVTLTCTGTFDDGSTQVVSQTPTLTKASLYEFDLQPEHMGFTLDDGNKKLIKYTFNIAGGETRTYFIDWTHYEKYWYLFIDNQIGGIDCIWLKGRAKYSPSGQRNLSAKPIERNAGVKTPTLVVSANTRQRSWTINTGIHTEPGMMEALDIMLDSPNMWLAIPPDDGDTDLSNYTLAPVVCNNGSLDLRNSLNNNVDSVDLELLEAHE